MDGNYWSAARWAGLVAFALGGCGPQGAVVGGRPTSVAAFSGDMTKDHFLGVEEVVQKFQLSGDQQPGPLTDSEVDARLAALPRLDEIVPTGKQQFMQKLDLSHDLSLGDADAQREVIDLRVYDVGMRDQGAEGLCTAFAAVAS